MPLVKARKSVQTCPLPAFLVKKPVRVKTAQSHHVHTHNTLDTQHGMQPQRFVNFAFSNALHLLLFNVFCLQLAPVPEKEPPLSTALTRVSVKEGEQGRAGDSERDDV